MDYDPDGIVSISGNQFTLLQAGTYVIRARAPALAVANHKARLQNITDGTTTGLGSSAFSGPGSTYADSVSFISVIFAIAAAKTFEIQHYCTTTQAATYGRGAATGLGDEKYTLIEIDQIA